LLQLKPLACGLFPIVDMKTILLALLAGAALLTGCQSNFTTSKSAIPAIALAVGSSSVSQSISQGVELNGLIRTPYLPAKLKDVVASPTSYSAILLCLPDSGIKLSVQVQLKLQRHAIEKLTILYARTDSKLNVKQIGNGVGHYDPKTQRYYFNVAYQVISELPDNRHYFSEPYEIAGWVSPQTSTAGVQPIGLAH
jgi:hypothetical protein